MRMTQAAGVCAWWAKLDEVDRGRVLCNDDDLLVEESALRLAGYGVSVVPASTSGLLHDQVSPISAADPSPCTAWLHGPSVGH